MQKALSVSLIYFCFWAVIFSYAIFISSHFIVAICVLSPIMLSGLIAVLFGYAKTYDLVKPLCSTSNLSIIVATTIILCVGIYSYAYLQAIQYMNRFLDELDIEVEQTSQVVNLLYGAGDVGFPRYVLTRYKIKEPYEVTKSKLSNALKPENNWQQEQLFEDLFVYTCQRSPDFNNVGDESDGVDLSDEGVLVIQLYYEIPKPCIP